VQPGRSPLLGLHAVLRRIDLGQHPHAPVRPAVQPRQQTGHRDARQHVRPQHRQPVPEIGPVGQRPRHQLDPGERPDQQVDRLPGPYRGQQLALFGSPFQQRRQPPRPLPERLAPVDPGRRLLVHRQPHPAAQQRVGAQPLPHREGHVDDLLQLAAARGHRPEEHLLGEDGLGERLLGGEVEVQGALGDFGPLQHHRDRGGGVPVLVEDRARGFQDHSASPDGPFLSCHVSPSAGTAVERPVRSYGTP
jgi:hypothetical protein